MKPLEEFLKAGAESLGLTYNPSDPCGFDPLPKEQWSRQEVHRHPKCYICNDPDFATHGLPLCFPCVLCGGHVAADDDVCDLCGAVQPRDPEEAEDPESIQVTGVELVRTDKTWVRLTICIVDTHERFGFGIGYGKTLCGKNWSHVDGDGPEETKDMNIALYKYPTCYKCTRVYWERMRDE